MTSEHYWRDGHMWDSGWSWVGGSLVMLTMVAEPGLQVGLTNEGPLGRIPTQASSRRLHGMNH